MSDDKKDAAHLQWDPPETDLRDDLVKLFKMWAQPPQLSPDRPLTIYLPGTVDGAPVPAEMREQLRSDPRYRVIFSDDPEFPVLGDEPDEEPEK